MQSVLLAALLFALLPAATVPAPVVVVLPLAAADTGLPYGLIPSPSELATMTAQLRAGVRSGGIRLGNAQRAAAELSAAGFDQRSPSRACATADCARRIGRSMHADVVVAGAVTREMAVVWSTEYQIVNVRTGKTREMSLGYKGDVQAMERGERYAGSCIARLIKNQPPCPPDRGW